MTLKSADGTLSARGPGTPQAGTNEHGFPQQAEAAADPRRLIVPLLALVAVLLGVLFTLLYRAVVDQNAQAKDNSIHVASAVFSNLSDSLKVEVRDYSWWQEAIDRMILDLDLDWAEDNIGAFVHANSDVATTIVLDADDTVRYAAVDSRHAGAEVVADYGPGLLALAARVRQSPMNAPEPAATFVTFRGEVHLAAAGAMTPETPSEAETAPRPRPVLIFTQRIDQERLDRISESYLIDGLRFAEAGRPGLYPLLDGQGVPVAGLTWDVPEPGTLLLHQLRLPAALVCLVVLGLMTLICRGIFRSADILREQNRRLARGEAIAVRALEEVVAASQHKSRFLARMSHELRTPLNAIIGFADTMRLGLLGPLNPRYQEYAGDILSSGRHLLSLVDGLLDLSRIEAGTLTLVREPVDVAAAIEASIKLVAGEAEAGLVSITPDVPRHLPRVAADARAMRQILINLLGNAVKFTPEGGHVRVSACVTPGRDLEIRVEDSGIGMTEEELQVAMEPFGRAETPFVRSRHGTGLGLPIARHLAEAQGARFAIASRPGAGTTITIVFPQQHEAPGRVPAGC